MGKKGQVLMVIVWILAILTVLAVTLGHRVSLALKMSELRRDAVVCRGLAKAGISRAVEELEQDRNTYDSLLEPWSERESLFSKIVLPGEARGTGSVGYMRGDGFGTRRVWGMVDEESKVNINTASRESLMALLSRYGIPDPGRLVRNILIWRGDIGDADKEYEELGYPPKKGPFAVVEELKAVKGMSGEYYEKIKDAVTVYGSGIVNINTASREVLGILCAGFAAQLSLDPALGDGVADKLVKERTGRGFWAEKNDIALPLTTAEEQNIFNRLLGQADIISENFLIEATGNIGTIKRTISAVYNRKKHRILSWHEY